MIRVVVVDDHLTARQQMIDQLKPGQLIEIVGEAGTSDQAFQVSEKLLPDVVLLDLYLPGLLQPITLIKKLIALRNVKVLVIADVAKGAEVQDLLEAGAAGYMLKNDPGALIRMSIMMIARGARNIISPSLPKEINHLTQQERIILHETLRRNKDDKAAQALGVSEEQLSATLSHLAQKLELGTITDLKKWAKKNGF